MKKYVMNKNVRHSGVDYKAGQELKESDSAFKELVSKGHATVHSFSDDVEAPQVEVSAEPVFPEEEAHHSKKPARKGHK